MWNLTEHEKIALTGPLADSKDVLGIWQFSEFVAQAISLRESMQKDRKAGGTNWENIIN